MIIRFMEDILVFVDLSSVINVMENFSKGLHFARE